MTTLPPIPGDDRDLVVFISMSRGIAGPARSLLTILRHLDDDIGRVLFAPPGNLTTLAQQTGAIDGYLPMPWRWQARGLSRIHATVRLARFVRRHRHRILAIHANGQTDLNLSALPQLVSGVPVVMCARTSHASPTAGTLRAFWTRPRRRVTWLAVSETAKAVLVDTLGLDEDDVEVVMNAIDPDDVVGDRPTEADTGRREVQVGFLGQPWPVKGWLLLPEIVRRVGPDGVGWQIFAARPDPAFSEDAVRVWEELRELSGEHHISLRGRTSNVAHAYARCDIVLCPSEQESFGRIAAEAMMNGLPVVASDLPPFRDLVQAPGAGLLFPTGDAAAAAEAIGTLAEDADLCREMGERGRAHVQRYTPDRVVPRFAAAYRAARDPSDAHA